MFFKDSPVIAAAMDLGSNTFRLLVVRVQGGSAWQVLERGLATPRLGRGLRPEGALASASRAAALEAAREFTARARALGAERVALAATQACRVAVDGSAFVAGLSRELGLDRAVVLTGKEEGRLARLGVLSRLEGEREGALMADVGGGSTELAALGRVFAPSPSLPLGAVSLTEAYLVGDPPAPAELAALDQAVDRVLHQARAGLKASRLVVTAGTAATLASLMLGEDTYTPERIDNLRVAWPILEQTAARLAGMPLADRRRALELDSSRADVIIAGLAIVRGLVRTFGLHEITAMDAGLLEGIFLDDLARTERREKADEHL
jgi:exopolyphosphatase/guanosine-5'-triphosphate,3'-diphosphate pyrophosphatase